MKNMSNILIGFDFSINKPSCTILKDDEYVFMSWPYDLPKKIREIYKESPLFLIDRTDEKSKVKDVSFKLRYEITNSKYLGSLIRDSIKPFIKNNSEIYIGFEGLSYASSGDVVLQLGGYKYMLMDILSEYTPLENMYTYSPMTIKKTAECSKKGMTKSDMIDKFKSLDNDFSKYLRDNEGLFKTRNGNWIVHLDDIVDSYYVLKTLEGEMSLSAKQSPSV